ncbi:COP9 signalosome catalytic subunit rri1 [Ascosphaera pollenicola]|nr:COP9 signalosome catalytic subunit rri1 [Ascosphaera pollenicola]
MTSPDLAALYNPFRDNLYAYDPDTSTVTRSLLDEQPWRDNPTYFSSIRISPIALSKMTIHARSGGSIEVMGLMTGYVLPNTIIVTDAFPLPVEGTETRVNAQEEAYPYMVSYLELSRSAGRLENCVGWYHSHPGYGCWLSGVDVETEKLQQGLNDPFCAVVIDPERTASSGRVEIGAFRTFKTGAGTQLGGSAAAAAEGGADQRKKKRTTLSKDSTATSLSSMPFAQGQSQQKRKDDVSASIPLRKLKDYGWHADEYYALEVSHYKSSLDSALLSQLNNRYWANTLSSVSSEANKEYATRQIQDFAAKIEAAGKDEKLNIRKAVAMASSGGDGGAGAIGSGGMAMTAPEAFEALEGGSKELLEGSKAEEKTRDPNEAAVGELETFAKEARRIAIYNAMVETTKAGQTHPEAR